jgi:hypothetical protein
MLVQIQDYGLNHLSRAPSAVKTLEQALTLRKDVPGLWGHLGIAYFRSGNYAKVWPFQSSRDWVINGLAGTDSSEDRY